jgi:hypothetical protein
MGCKNTGTTCISGVWSIDDLIGATVSIVASSCGDLGTFRVARDTDEEFVVDDVIFRITEDGKIMPGIVLEGIEGRIYNLREIKILAKAQPVLEAICGEFLCSQAMAGYGSTSSDASTTEGGLSVIDEAGNVISNRYIRLGSATVEDITTDEDEITDIDINVTGNVLD